MQTFQFQRCSRRCCRTGRTLEPGRVYYSAVVPRGEELVRLDYSAEAWDGPPPEAIGWWKGRVPTPQEARAQMASDEALLEWLEQLASQPEQADLRYVLALLLVRRRVLKFAEPDAADPGAEKVLKLYWPADPQRQFQVQVVWPSGQRIQQIESQLKQILFPGEHVPEEHAPETRTDPAP